LAPRAWRYRRGGYRRVPPPHLPAYLNGELPLRISRARSGKLAHRMSAAEELPKLPFMAGRRHRRDSTERLLKDIQQPVKRQRPLWIVEPPLSTGERMSVNDPEQSPNGESSLCQRSRPPLRLRGAGHPIDIFRVALVARSIAPGRNRTGALTLGSGRQRGCALRGAQREDPPKRVPLP
jgi:hypothetical protein